ncbi:uncharacterized protein BO97DRAFT_469953 [Aspergillus homomorphus CBS 101889]|uniref:Zn(2)-C6 fungal-type domain-containing protein n=1 Tax=Aspergillus homomorphus (strain CBS 101889) TaxID=1450537 RepID=A0A395HZM5_ASPHC|nr:hypothetical protein BO97DRAFT_469953 [Aspergillus homomorphus CBS 101889]RAL13250.1 hypothetical protein BO97DRAFT_469953 [Aspergillus homomorphus CBS 101889]
MRIGRGCERCRLRHIRCTTRAGASSCNACTRLGRACRLDPLFRFKTVRHVYQKNNGTASKFELVWNPQQTWVKVPHSLTFVQESSEDSDGDNTSDVPANTQEDGHATSDDAPQVFPQHFSICSPLPFLEADVCDLRSHFATEVPRRALLYPMVLKAVLALAARHDAMMNGTSDWEASEYHGQCLELLIAALALPEETYDDNLLITVVILRIYEELEFATDEKCHWVGSNRLLNRMSNSASSGGLAEAVSWQFLRQALYACVVQHQPMQLNLENYERSVVFQRRDDASYANIIIFYCAKIFRLWSGSHCSPVDEAAWQHLADSVEQWYNARPISWQPLQYKNASPNENRPFPEMWMMSPQAACIFLSVSDRHWSVVSDYELARLKRVGEKTISSHLTKVIGLSMSNETVENAYFMACHLLHRCTSSTTITSQADADNRLASCSTIHGTLTISPSATGTITLKQLEKLNAGLTIQNASALTGFSAPNLETVNGQFSIKNNAQFSTLTLSNLKTVSGELDIDDNSQLRDLVFDDLQYVNGALILSGKFDRISFNDLKHVNGKTNIRSRGGSFRCSSLKTLRNGDDDDDDDDGDHNNNDNNGNSVFKGSYSCSDGSSSGLSTGAKAGIAIGVILVVLLMILLVWVLMHRNRSRRKRRNAAENDDKSGYTAVGVRLSHERKTSNMDEKVKPQVSEPPEADPPINLDSIPRKPLSPPPPSASTDAHRTVSTLSPSSPPLPTSLLPGMDPSSSSVPTSDYQNALFLHATPRRRPSETDVPLLDSGNVHEVPASPIAHGEVYELDAGPVRGTHQQPISHE